MIPSLEPAEPRRPRGSGRTTVLVAALAVALLAASGLLLASLRSGGTPSGAGAPASPSAPEPATPSLAAVGTSPARTVASTAASATAASATAAPSTAVPSEPPLAIARHPRALVPTDRVVAAGESYPNVFADRDGIVWGYESGHLVRYDPASGATRAWTVADDAAFEARDVVAARGGGVWLLGATEAAWFDGERMRDVVPLPAGASGWDVWAGIAESSVWPLLATAGGHVWSWTGTAWNALPDPPTTEAGVIGVDAEGGVWVSLFEYPGPACRGVARLVWGGWSATDAGSPLASSCVTAFRPAADGTMWAVDESRASRLGEVSWQPIETLEPPIRPVTAMSLGPDGTAWFVTNLDPASEGPGPVRVAAFRLPSEGSDGTQAGPPPEAEDGWNTYGTTAGLPSGVENGWVTWPSIAATGDGVFAGTGAGVFRLVDGAWARVVPAADASGGPNARDLTSLAAVSRDEAYAQDARDVWWWHDRRWARIGEAAGVSIPDQGRLRIAPDGALWVAGLSGVRRFAGGRWETLATVPADSIAFDANGAAYVAVRSPPAVRPAVRVYRRSGDGWTMTTFPSPLETVASVLVDRSGGFWVTGDNGWAGDRRGCVARHSLVPSPLSQPWWTTQAPVLTPDGDVAPCAANALTLAQDGDVLLTYDPVAESWGADRRVARWDAATQTWTVWGTAEGLPLVSDGTSPIAVATDGTVWVGTNGGLARLDGTGWTIVRGGAWGSVSAAPDGSVWAVGPAGLERIAP